jgi:PKD repeat protein
MKQNRNSEAGIFTLRVFVALTLCLLGSGLAMLTLAGTPRSAKLFNKSAKISPPQSSSIDAPPPTSSGPGIPRYYSYSPGPGFGEAAGEPSIGFNPSSGKVMYIASLQTLQATLPEDITPKGSVPDACDAAWQDVSFTTTRVRSADSILFTDQGTGRTFVSQLNTVTQTSPVLIGLNSLMAYTDDDGANWTPAQINPPDGSNDHETVGAGPYPAALSALANPVNKGHAVYYCGQLNVGGEAFCSRSDDGGLNFGKSILVSADAVNNCGAGIHGHVKVAPDGTVYLPNGLCSNGSAVFVSTNAGATWTEHTIPGSRPMASAIAPATFDISDPSVGIASDGTVYFAWTGLVPNGNSTDNHIWVAVSHDQGATWTTPFDLGAAIGIKNAVFASAVAGDPNRAAVAFIGTTQGGDHQSANFQGTWYGFVAHTYDSGQTWTLVNATPDGPVQRNACIWNSGGNNTCRNLLDFNDATMDDKGRVLFAYADGCVDQCKTGAAPNSYASKATIARQSGGKGLLAQFDMLEPTVPRRACLSGQRDDIASHLSWIAPDNGGNVITAYNVYRGTSSGNETTFVASVDGSTTSFDDLSVDVNVATYYYKIVAANGSGSGPFSNEIALTVGPRLSISGACSLPGVTTIVDPAGDETDGQQAHDITSISMAEPETDAVTGAASNVVFTMKVASFKDSLGNFTIAPGFRWSIRFGVIHNGVLLPAPPSGIPGDTSTTDYYVAMASNGMGPSTTPGMPSFEWGVTSTPNNTARVFTPKGSIDPSSIATADGTITLVMPKSIITNAVAGNSIAPGDTIAITLASVRGDLPSGTNDTIFDSTGPGSYTLRALNFCFPDTPPLAVLSANVSDGLVPLTVNFDASGSSDPNPPSVDTISSYTFNFGDGGGDVTQTSPKITHVYNTEGDYTARLVVTNSRGKVSSNVATFNVNVERVLALASIASRMTHGSAGTFDIDLPLTGTAGIECRAPGPNNSFTLVYTFNKSVSTTGTASKTQGTGTAGQTALGQTTAEVIVPVTGVTNAQHFILQLNSVRDSVGSPTLNGLSGRLDVLMGDVDASGRVDSTDTFDVRQGSLQTTNSSNFRLDIDASGRIDSNDVFLTRQQSLTSLP